MPGPHWMVVSNRGWVTPLLVSLEHSLKTLEMEAFKNPRGVAGRTVLRGSTTDEGLDCYIDLNRDDEIVLREATTEDLVRLATQRILSDPMLALSLAKFLVEQPEGDDHLAWVINATQYELLAWLER